MRLLRKTPLLSTALAVSLLVTESAAASTATTLPNLSNALAAQSSSAVAQTGSTTEAGSTGTTNTAQTSESKSLQSSSVIITGSGSTATSTGSIPVITGGNTATTGGALPTGLPTLSGAFSIVAPSVPPTANAPYMQTSNLPEGSVFIAVGAILGFFGFSVLMWRGLVAWSLHRSVKRAAQHQNMATDTKALFRAPPAPLYKYSDRDSTISLSGLGHKGGKKGNRPSTAGAASSSSLFFSPTAGTAGAGLANSGNRGLNYLPAGYYASGAAAPGNSQSHIPMGGQGHGSVISLSNLGPQQGYSRARSIDHGVPGTSPYASQAGMTSSSTLNLNRGYGGGEERAPSAYLDDLFDGEEPLPLPGHQRVNSTSSHNKY
jgi:hypothetical protein